MTYAETLHRLVAAAVSDVLRVYDAAVPGLVEDVPRERRGALALLLAVRVAAWRRQSAALADVAVSAWLTRARRRVVPVVGVAPPAGDAERLTEAITTLLDRAEELQVGADDDEPSEDEPKDAAAGLEGPEDELARLRSAWARQDAARAARQRRAERDTRRAERVEGRPQRRAEGRQERRAAQRARVERLATEEPYRAAADALQEAAVAAPEVAGWVRGLGPTACETCQAWADGKVRPMTIKMKRHPACDCTQELLSEGTDRERADKPEPVSARWRRARDREQDAARAAAGAG